MKNLTNKQCQNSSSPL